MCPDLGRGLTRRLIVVAIAIALATACPFCSAQSPDEGAVTSDGGGQGQALISTLGDSMRLRIPISTRSTPATVWSTSS